MADTDSHLHVVAQRDEIDPELVKLRRRLPVGPLLAFSVLGFAVYLMVTLRADFFYAQAGGAPKDLGAAAELVAKGGLSDNQYVSIHGELDYAGAANLHARHGGGFRLVPILGTQRRFWLRVEGEATNVSPVYDDRWTGRLREMARTPVAPELAKWLAKARPEARFVYPETLGPGALRPDGLPARDVYGEPLSVLPDTPITIEERSPEAAEVTFVATDTVKDAAGAAAALARAGLGPADAKPVEQTESSWTFRVPGADLAAITAKLRAVKIFGAEAAPVILKHEGTVKDLKIAGDQVTLGGAVMPRSAILHIALRPASPLPKDAWILFEGETPATFWYIRPLFGVLALLALLMLWAGTRAVLRLRTPVRPALVED